MNSLLSAPDSPLGIKSLLEGLFEELNSFSELSIRFGPSCTLDLKLFPFYGNPAPVEDWEVPVSLVPLMKMRSQVAWDLTMYRIVPFIDGTATVRKIAHKADVDIYLTHECMQHLVYYGCCVMTDPFRFSNCYTIVGGPIWDALGDSNTPEAVELQEELEAYIEQRPGILRSPVPHLLQLYAEFKSGTTVHDWMEQNEVHKLDIDVRRFISFGTIKGFLKRLHCYPIWALHPDICASPHSSFSTPAELKQRTGVPGPSLASATRHNSRVSVSASTSGIPGWLAVLKRMDAAPEVTSKLSKRHSKTVRANQHSNNPVAVEVPKDLPIKLNGQHHLDELCVEYQISLIQLEQMLRYIDTLSLEESNVKERPFGSNSAMQTIYY